MFRPITLWPFPEDAFREAIASATYVLVPELNAGQMILEIERLCAGTKTVGGLNRIDGEPIDPIEIEGKVRELINDERA